MCEEEAQDQALPVKGEACEEADREAEMPGSPVVPFSLFFLGFRV